MQSVFSLGQRTKDGDLGLLISRRVQITVLFEKDSAGEKYLLRPLLFTARSRAAPSGIYVYVCVSCLGVG